MKRREFLKTSAAGAAAFSTLSSGLWPSPARADRARVALVKTTDRAKGVEDVLILLGAPSPKGKKVFIKPNFNTADPAPGSTDNATLGRLVREMKARGALEVTVGDRSGPPKTAQVLADKGIPAMAAELGFKVIDFEELPADGWVHFNPPGNHWANGFDIAKPVVEAEYLVSACCLKTHGFGGVFTMSLKLAVGITPKSLMRELHGARNTHMRRMIAEINQGYAPQLIVLDGVEAFVDGGPSTGKKVEAGIVLAGTDRVAVDAVGLAVLKDLGSNEAVMSKAIFAQEQIERAVELGLGIGGPGEIEIVASGAEGRAYADKLKAVLAQG
ncbi:MAG: DUF362 domain-containing protein [Candidatus Aminicenantes bacterium]|nr:DUF362 domain-containing protein [Candidatus Aminicenantes bacterium]